MVNPGANPVFEITTLISREIPIKMIGFAMDIMVLWIFLRNWD